MPQLSYRAKGSTLFCTLQTFNPQLQSYTAYKMVSFDLTLGEADGRVLDNLYKHGYGDTMKLYDTTKLIPRIVLSVLPHPSS